MFKTVFHETNVLYIKDIYGSENLRGRLKSVGKLLGSTDKVL